MAMKLNAGEVGRQDMFSIDPKEIIVNEAKNGRRFPHGDPEVGAMCASYEFVPEGGKTPQGQLVPVQVRRIQENRVELVLGFRRYKAMIMYNEKHPDAPMKLKCMVVVVSEEEAFRRNVVENKDREATTPLDDAYNQRRFREEFGWSERQIADFYRMSEGYVGQLKLLPGLPEQIQDMIANRTLSVKAGLELTTISDEAKKEVLAEVVATGKVTSAEVITKVRDKKLDAGGKTSTARSMKEVRDFLEGLKEDEQLGKFAHDFLRFIQGKIKNETMANKLREVFPMNKVA